MKNRIKTLREQHGMKQRELAKELGVSQNTLSTWETGRYEPDAEMLKKIAYALNVSVDYLIGGDPPWSDLHGDQIDFLRMNRLMKTVQQLTAPQFDLVLSFCQDVLIGGDGGAALPGTVSDEEQQLLQAYHALPLEIRRAVDGLMEPYKPATESEKKMA